MSTAAADIQTLGEVRDIHDIVPSPLNPRHTFDPERLKELAASIEQKGVIEPLIVRTRPGFGQLEIVAGERRYRAAKSVGLKQLPVIIRTLTDVEVLELMAIENLQRDDLHPLEEADGYAALMKADRAYTPKAIAAKIGKSERYVQQRLQLATLQPEVKKAFLANHLTAGHADLISRLKPEDQKAALKACFANLYGEDKENGSISVRSLNEWIQNHIRLQLDHANPELQHLPEVGQLIAETEKPETLLQVHRNWGQQVKGALEPRAYKVVDGKKDRCPQTERAVVVQGDDRGTIIEICRQRTTCKKHFKYEIEGSQSAARESNHKPTKYELQQKAREKRQRLWSQVKKAAIAEAASRAGDKLTPGVLKVLAYGVMRFHYNGQASTLAAVVRAAAEQAAYANESTFNSRIAKPLGINLTALFKAAKKKPAHTSAARAKKTAKGEGR